MANQLVRTALDAAAAAALGGAVWFALANVIAMQPLLASCAAAIVFLRVFASLVRLPEVPVAAGARFVPLPLEFDEQLEELVLDQPFEQTPIDPEVVRVLAPGRTPGEMREAIERHLASRRQPAPDATEELREALAQLRRASR